jgi:MFS family permease
MHEATGRPSTQARRVLLASLVGTAIEYYDFYIYATGASLVFGPLFFPATSPSAQLMSAYASFGVAFLARPLGGVVFGHFGDRIGRKSTLVVSLLLMGGSTAAVALLPTYARIGWWAPFLLCLLRVGQGLGLGGEWSGASLLAIENAPAGWRARYGIFPQLGAPIGFFCANGLFLVMGALLSPQQFHDWGWRLPFLLSLLLVGIGLWVRFNLSETPAFAAALDREPPARIPLMDLLRNHAVELRNGTLAVIGNYALFYIATAFLLGEATTTMGFEKQTILLLEMAGILLMALGIVVAGWWADRTEARRVLLFGCLGAVVAGALFAPLVGSRALLPIGVFILLSLAVMGVIFGPISTFLSLLFPPRVRYTGVALTYNVGSILGGALTPIAAKSLADWGGLGWVGAYLAGAALVSFCAVGLGGRRKQRMAQSG